MKRTKIVTLLQSEKALDNILIQGWVRTRRSPKNFSFLEINDGSCLKNIQIIAEEHIENYSIIEKITTGTAVSIKGDMVESPGKGQRWEIKANKIDIIGIAGQTYPLQKKRHSDEFLRTIAHLRPRTNKYGATFRIRSELSYAIHKFFKEKNFYYLHTPIITESDCEGAGEMFKVTTLTPESFINPQELTQDIYSKDFFGKEAGLTVSGQLSAEMFALALGDVYTFGPTFRAENSNTSRHAAEFWMVEPEMAFCDLEESMALAEEFIKYLTNYALETCNQDIELFTKFVDKTLMHTLDAIISNDFQKIQYKDAIDILKKSHKKFEYEVDFGTDLQSEHERFLAEEYFKKPVFIYNYPKQIKPFYMRLNDDQSTVAAMDLLVPQIGELIGGSQREERLDILEKQMDEINLNKKDYWWYLDSRRYGSVPHSGFGLGFERLIMLITGISNIRDVIPFPRTPHSIEF